MASYLEIRSGTGNVIQIAPMRTQSMRVKVVSNDVVTDSARRIHLVRRLSCVSDLHFHR